MAGDVGHTLSTESYLFLSLDGKKRRVPLDLIGLDMEGARLELLASDLRATDAERRLAGEALDAATEVAPAPEPVRTKGHSADELGEEVERFGPGAGGPVFFICFGAVGLLAGVAFSLYVYLVHPEGWPIALIPLGFGALWGLALIAPSVKWSRAHLVLCQYGMRYVGGSRGGRGTLRYADIRRTAVVVTLAAGPARRKAVRPASYCCCATAKRLN